MKPTTPKKVNSDINLLVESLGLNVSDIQQLKLRRVEGFSPVERYCHINCLKQQQLFGNNIQFGWVIWQDKSIGFTEAEFHAVVVDETGQLSDITPRVDGEKRIMFIPDHVRKPVLTSKSSGLIENITYTNHKILKGKIYEATSTEVRYLEPDKLALIGAKL